MLVTSIPLLCRRKGFLLAGWVLSLALMTFDGAAQALTKYIVTDQFGYLPGSRKVAVIRDPQTGFDGTEAFTPGTTYRLVNKATGQAVFEAAPVSWKNGQEDVSSGDKAWWFDFSSVTANGEYYVLDVQKNVKSYDFNIHPAVYQNVLKQAVRTYYYQRAGMAKEARYAGEAWADAINYAGPLQDTEARLYNAMTNAATRKDLHGGWFDAGDFNKYVNFAHPMVIQLLMAYEENPTVFADNYNLPESGNGIPDLLDEVKYEIDWLLRMQETNGSVLSLVGYQGSGSPPSSDKTRRAYGPASTSATLTGAAIYAYGARIFGSLNRPDMTAYAQQLREAAVKAWNWAQANPALTFRNNDAANGSQGLGAGQAEVDDYGRLTFKISAAAYLFALTGEAPYQTFIDQNFSATHLSQWSYAYPFEPVMQDALLYYASLPGATPAVAADIKSKYGNSLKTNEHNLPAYLGHRDPYRAHIQAYTWGSNNTKANQGQMLYTMIGQNLDPGSNTDYLDAAESYIHYLHGVNPLAFVYLSNMFGQGAENGVREFYHTWYTNGSAKWDRVGTSESGPPPGYVTGGPNPSYNWDSFCPGTNGCNSESISPPKGQPAQKSYKDFNTSWPLNSWEVTENSTGYQASYIRLLSKFVSLTTNPPLSVSEKAGGELRFYPNPAGKTVLLDWSRVVAAPITTVTVRTLQGALVHQQVLKHQGQYQLHTGALANGVYIVTLQSADQVMTEKLVIRH